MDGVLFNGGKITWPQTFLKRQDIYCLERNTNAYIKMLSNPFLNGCNFYNMTLKDFINTNDNIVFNIISLDFMGQLGTFDVLPIAES